MGSESGGGGREGEEGEWCPRDWRTLRTGGRSESDMEESEAAGGISWCVHRDAEKATNDGV